MANDLIKLECNVDLVAELQHTNALVESLMKTKHYAKMGPETIYAIVQKSKSLELNPFDALNGMLYCVSGRVGMATELMASLIRAKGHSIKQDPASNETVCVLIGTRRDNGDNWKCSFSINDAKKAGIFKGVWDKYPAIMCYNRCMSMLARQLFPDVIKGCGYGKDELEEIAESNNSRNKKEQVPAQTVTIQGEVLEAPIEKITQSQVNILNNMIDQDLEKEDLVKHIFKLMKIHSVEDVPQHRYEKLFMWIQERQKAQKEDVNVVVEEVQAPSVFDPESADDRAKAFE